MRILSAFSQLLSDRGISMMEAFGIADVALISGDAVVAAEALLGTGVAILGGDVFYRTADGFKLAYDNWSTEPMPGEDVNTYVARSIRETREYIQGYAVVRDKVALFALVVAEVN